MADHSIPHFHNDPGAATIRVGVKEFMCTGRAAAIRPSPCLHRHGRRRRGDLPLLRDPLRLSTPASARIRFPPSASSATRPDAVTRRALVVGAGIGGLAAALALARQGFGVDVFERAPALQEFGAGLQLTPNATRALARLGALAAAREVASAPRAVRVLRGADGAELARLPIEGAERRWGAPYLAVHRVDLHRVLAEAAAATGQVALHFGAEVAGVASEARRPPRSASSAARSASARPARRSSAPTACARWCARGLGAARPTRRGFPTAWRSAPRSRPNGSPRAGATTR